MMFQTVKAAIITLLSGYTATQRFSLMSYQQQKHDADAIAEYNRHVVIYYKGGQFGPGSRPGSGVVQHDMTFQIEMLVSAHALVDLSSLDDPNAGATQRMSALGAYYDAGQHADDLMDDLWSVLFNILEDPRNYDLGLAAGTIAEYHGPRLADFQKSDVSKEGQTVLLGASATLKLRCTERPTGESGGPLVGIESNIQPGADIATGGLDAAEADVDVENGK